MVSFVYVVLFACGKEIMEHNYLPMFLCRDVDITCYRILSK